MKPLWEPSQDRIKSTEVYRFIREINDIHQTTLVSFEDLYAWSIKEPELFWRHVWHFCSVIGDLNESPFTNGAHKFEETRIFPKATLNYAENLLQKTHLGIAIHFWGESQFKKTLSWPELLREVSQMAQVLKELGVKKGDRVAGLLPNIPETVISMLATASLGAIWSSCSPEFGHQGVLDRFGQIEPCVLIASDGYLFQGKVYDCRDKIEGLLKSLPSVQMMIVVPYVFQKESSRNDPKTLYYDECLSAYKPGPIDFVRVPFNHPLFILYSSGTTGVPKCIVHGHGGTLLQLLKEHSLHCDIHAGDRVFYYTTCGWMMWNWLVTCLASGASISLYDGSPLASRMDILFDLSDDFNVTHFGASAKYFDALKKAQIMPGKNHHLSSLKYVFSTGSPLAPHTYDYLYEALDRDVCLSSISGGTDIVSCFFAGNPMGPVWRGELQSRGLGLSVEVFDQKGQSVLNQKGELVCTAPFPSMPLGFWGDDSGEKFHQAYFADYPNVWAHRDYVELTDRGSGIIYGRSDATLNPGGVRIGTAEIYRQVEKLDAIEESLAIGQSWRDDVRIILFVKLKDGYCLDDALRNKIKRVIQDNTTPRHVPRKIIDIPAIPKTMSGKIVEMAVSHIVHNLPVKNIEALANPEALEFYKNIASLQED